MLVADSYPDVVSQELAVCSRSTLSTGVGCVFQVFVTSQLSTVLRDLNYLGILNKAGCSWHLYMLCRLFLWITHDFPNETSMKISN